jgi:putative FmdB family regulatory protein
MPLYDYKCNGCGHQFEKLVGNGVSEPRKCPECGKIKLARLLFTRRPPAVHMKYSPMHPRHGRGQTRR